MRGLVDCNIQQKICRLVVSWRINIFNVSMKDVIWCQVILQACDRHEAVLEVALLWPLLDKSAEYGLSMDLEYIMHHSIALQQYRTSTRRMPQSISSEWKDLRLVLMLCVCWKWASTFIILIFTKQLFEIEVVLGYWGWVRRMWLSISRRIIHNYHKGQQSRKQFSALPRENPSRYEFATTIVLHFRYRALAWPILEVAILDLVLLTNPTMISEARILVTTLTKHAEVKIKNNCQIADYILQGFIIPNLVTGVPPYRGPW